MRHIPGHDSVHARWTLCERVRYCAEVWAAGDLAPCADVPTCLVCLAYEHAE